MKRRILAWILILAMLLLFVVSCGLKDPEEDPAGPAGETEDPGNGGTHSGGESGEGGTGSGDTGSGDTGGTGTGTGTNNDPSVPDIDWD